jgi:hypothetical protein
MTIKKNSFSKILSYIWWLIGLVIILFIVSQNIITERVINYQLDLADSISPDLTGWYPEVRLAYNPSIDQAQIINEPLYLQVYRPVDFETLAIEGSIGFIDEDIRLGLKQTDNSWQWQNISSQDFLLQFDLDNAKVSRNKLELILSIPDLHNNTSTVDLSNNWQIILQR